MFYFKDIVLENTKKYFEYLLFLIKSMIYDNKFI